MLINKDFLTWLLIVWWQWCQPIWSQVWASFLLIWILARKFLSKHGNFSKILHISQVPESFGKDWWGPYECFDINQPTVCIELKRHCESKYGVPPITYARNGHCLYKKWIQMTSFYTNKILVTIGYHIWGPKRKLFINHSNGLIRLHGVHTSNMPDTDIFP